MRVGILSPTTWQLVEKLASLFAEGVEVVGPLADNQHYWNDYRRKQEEWRELDLHVSLRLEPYEQVDFSPYHVLVESVETFSFANDWAAHCHRLECPIIVKACWTRDPLQLAPSSYLEKAIDFPVLLEMPAHAATWKNAGFADVTVLPNPVGDWWLDQEWTGEKEQVLFVLSGSREWRGDPTRFGLDLWEEICRRFPGKTYLQDGHVEYKTSKEMAALFRQSRVFVNLDRPYGQGERPLTLAFTEALSAGLPVVARNLPGLNYRNFIDSNGVCTDDIDAICAFIERCLRDWDFARRCGARSRQIALQNFSFSALRPKYDRIIRRAKAAYDSRMAGTSATAE